MCLMSMQYSLWVCHMIDGYAACLCRCLLPAPEAEAQEEYNECYYENPPKPSEGIAADFAHNTNLPRFEFGILYFQPMWEVWFFEQVRPRALEKVTKAFKRD